MKDLSKKYLLKALKEAGLPYTLPNFILKYENKICKEHNKPFLVSSYGEKKTSLGIRSRMYSEEDIQGIISAAKGGWFDKHWHWPSIL